MHLDVGVVSDAIDAKLAGPSGLDTVAVAAGIHAIVNNNMAAATRSHIAEKSAIRAVLWLPPVEQDLFMPMG